MIGAAVAILAWIRWRDTGETVALYECSAFVALTVVNVMMIGIVFIGKESAFGLDASQPGEAPIYLWTEARAVVAAILVIGAARSLRREAPPLPPLFLAVGPALVLVLSAIMLFGREAILPQVPGAEAFDPNGAACSGRPRSRPPSCCSRSRSSSASSWRPSSCAGSTSGMASCQTRTLRRVWWSPPSASCISRSIRWSRPGS